MATVGARDMPLRLLLRFSDVEYESRFVRHYVAFYRRYAQVSLLLGIVLIAGDYLVDHLAFPRGRANALRLTAAVPVLAAGLAYSWLPNARRYWQPVMASFITCVAFVLFTVLVRIDQEGQEGLMSWVGVLNFTFLQFYCFVILGVQFRYALVAGLTILAAFLYALWTQAGLMSSHSAYWTYHVVTVVILAAGIGWWREYLLRKEYVARAELDDSRQAAEARALRLAHYDEVTGLPNRRLFAELSEPALARALRQGSACAVVHLEIDRLRNVHDLFGPSVVDQALTAIAQRLRARMRSSDVAASSASSMSGTADESGVVARYGDNTFTLLVTDLDSQERASMVAQRLLGAVAQPIEIDGQLIALSASAGIAMFPGDATDIESLTSCAQQATRAAAQGGGAHHTFFDDALNQRVRERLQLEAELRRAIGAGELCLHYQPKVDARTGALTGAEALLRWQHPQRGLVFPGQFIELAEETGLIEPLTHWLLHETCGRLHDWTVRRLALVPISVNLAASSLADAALLSKLDGLMADYALDPSLLTLELTETMVMRDMEGAIDVLRRLRARGFGLSLDDFGTGYSSLGHLKRLPMTELKIDRAFVIDVARGGRDGALAAAVITLGRELGLQVVAEGVETTEQSDFLLERGCVVQQGYLFSRPVPCGNYEAMMAQGAAAA